MKFNISSTTVRITTLGALLMGVASAATAQKAKPPAGPPITTVGSAKSSPKADKGQATAEASRMEARERKAEHNAVLEMKGEPKTLLKGIKLEPEQKKSIEDIDKKYDGQLKELEKADHEATKAGTPDTAFVSKVTALRIQERAEVRAVLTADQRELYDKNISALPAKKS